MPTARRLIDLFHAATDGVPRFLARAMPKGEDEVKAPVVGELYLYDAIGADMWGGGVGAKEVARALDEFQSQGVKELCIYLNSPGGDVFEAVAIYNNIKRFAGKKTIYVDGLAASAASLLAMAGDEIVTAPNAMWMIHMPWGFAIGNADDMRKTAGALDQTTDVMLDTYCARTKQSKEQVRAWMADETWMTPAEALKRGFTDKVTPAEEPEKVDDPDEEEKEPQSRLVKPPAQAQAFPLLSRYKNTPKDLREAALSSRALVASLEQRLNHRRRASPTPPAGPPAPRQ